LRPEKPPTTGFADFKGEFPPGNGQYIDLEQRTHQTVDNPFGANLSPMS
jgi:hypothetical protein